MVTELKDATQNKWFLVRTALGAGGNANVRVPATGNKLRLRSVHITALGATIVTLRFGASDNIFEFDLAANSVVERILPGQGIVGATDAALVVVSSAATTVGVTAFGTEE